MSTIGEVLGTLHILWKWFLDYITGNFVRKYLEYKRKNINKDK